MDIMQKSFACVALNYVLLNKSTELMDGKFKFMFTSNREIVSYFENATTFISDNDFYFDFITELLSFGINFMDSSWRRVNICTSYGKITTEWKLQRYNPTVAND